MRWRKAVGLALAVFGLAAGTGVATASAQGAGSYNWSGLYFGGHVGGAWTDSMARDIREPAGGWFAPLGGEFHFDDSGVAGGAQVGYQHQIGRWVVGAEVSGTWSALYESVPSPYFASDRLGLDIGPIFMATARLGYTWDRWMAYVKGGYAGASIELRGTDPVNSVTFLNDHWQDGYTLGAGLEYALMPGVRLGLDYSFIDLYAERMTAWNTLGGRERFWTDAEIHSVMARVNFQLSRPDTYETLK